MSRIQYNGRVQANQNLFASARFNHGGLAARQGINFGGVWATVLIGPDLSLPGMRTNNPPSIGGSVWDTVLGAGRPTVAFVNDANNTWIRGHLVNGEWRGPGNQWQNMVPLTALANHNHLTIEDYMRAFALASLAYDNAAYRNDWIGIVYLVQCAQDPWAAVPANNQLYSYTPAFIKVSWRAVSIPKPNLQAANVQGYLDGLAAIPNTTLPVLPFPAPARPAALPAAAGSCLPAAGNVAGGLVFAGPAGFPAAQNNGFDGDVEIHQS